MSMRPLACVLVPLMVLLVTVILALLTIKLPHV